MSSMRLKGKDLKMSKKRPEFKKCQNCNTRFEVRRVWQKFCNDSCRSEYHTKLLNKLRDEFRQRS